MKVKKVYYFVCQQCGKQCKHITSNYRIRTGQAPILTKCDNCENKDSELLLQKVAKEFTL